MNIGLIGPIKENYKQNESPEIIPKEMSDSEDFSSLSSISEPDQKERINLLGNDILSRNNSEEVNEQSHEKVTDENLIILPKLLDSPRPSITQDLSIQPITTPVPVPIEPVNNVHNLTNPSVIPLINVSNTLIPPIVNTIKSQPVFTEKKSKVNERNFVIRFFDKIYMAIVLIKDSIKNFIFKR